MTYAVEDYDFWQYKRPLLLFRYADDADGHWWADNPVAARLHGKGFHSAPTLHRRIFEPEQILARLSTRFGRQMSPPEFIVST